MMRKVIVLFFFLVESVVVIGEGREKEDYILVLNSINFDEAWTRGLYQIVNNAFVV